MEKYKMFSGSHVFRVFIFTKPLWQNFKLIITMTQPKIKFGKNLFFSGKKKSRKQNTGTQKKSYAYTNMVTDVHDVNRKSNNSDWAERPEYFII